MSTCRCTRRRAMSRWSHPSKPARRWSGPTRSPSSAGFVISRRRCADRRERHVANLSNGESHYLWGRRYLLTVVEKDAKPFVSLGHRRITLTVRPGSTTAKREKVIHEWHKALLHEAVPPLVHKWEAKLGSRGCWLLSPAHENKVGRLPPSCRTHPPQYGAREKAERPVGVCRRPRSTSPHRANAQRALHGAAEQTLPDMARSAGRA